MKNLEQITIRGPFWQAQASIVKSAEPTNQLPAHPGQGTFNNWAWRALFVTPSPKLINNLPIHTPQTIVALCYVTQIELRAENNDEVLLHKRWSGRDDSLPATLTMDTLKEGKQAGTLSLLLLQADEEVWAKHTKWSDNKRPTFTCLNGEINLYPLLQTEADRKHVSDLYDLVDLEETGHNDPIILHSGGLYIYGKKQLLWSDRKFDTYFQLAREFADNSFQPRFLLALDVSRLSLTTRQTLIEIWRDLGHILTPDNPLIDIDRQTNTPMPKWATLEQSDPLRLPNLRWLLDFATGKQAIRFDLGEFALVLSDAPLYNEALRPNTVARITLTIEITRTESGNLYIDFATDGSASGTEIATYTAIKLDSVWDETWHFANITLAPSPVEASQQLREAWHLPTPDWETGKDTSPLSDPLLWGFMPLVDGWAQLPFPNLTKQIYFDASIANVLEVNDQTIKESVFETWSGAVSLTNIGSLPEEETWNVSLLNAAHISGRWTLVQKEDGLALDEAEITLWQPELVIDGLLWWSTDVPTIENALPEGNNWVGGMFSTSIQTTSRSFIYPPIVRIGLQEFVCQARELQDRVSASLHKFTFDYSLDTNILTQFKDKNVLPTEMDTTPIVWRRHASLPMIQALPLTQNKFPPNHPSPSRQFVPFVPKARNGLLDFSASEKGAKTWWKVVTPLEPMPAWADNPDLPLVALTLPGWQLAARGDPKTASGFEGQPAKDKLLPLQQYRFDLPYMDEVYALSALPDEGVPEDTSTPLPERPAPERLQPLTPTTFAKQWRRLADKASLAAADGVAALATNHEQSVIRHVVEPYLWHQAFLVDDATYPGSLQFGEAFSYQGDGALTGISARFAEVAGNKLEVAKDGSLIVEGGTMQALVDNGIVDQRGLRRGVTDTHQTLIQTPVQLVENSAESLLLTTLLQPEELYLPNTSWPFWCRDLPVRRNTGAFVADDVRSNLTQDINDPGALSRQFDFRSGYEWRLGATNQPLTVLGLEFYPLRLTHVHVDDQRLARVEIVGRLQLPIDLSSPQSLEAIDNSVRLRFERDNDVLTLTEVISLSEKMAWPLRLKDDALTNAPTFVWNVDDNLNLLVTDPKPMISIPKVMVEFYLFDFCWRIPFGTLQFDGSDEIKVEEDSTDFALPLPFTLEKMGYSLKLGSYTLSLRIGITLGDMPRDVSCILEFPLNTVDATVKIKEMYLFEKQLPLEQAEQMQIVYTEQGAGVQFAWQTLKEDRFETAFLPGMLIDGDACTGFVAFTLRADLAENGIPKLQLEVAFAEALLSCRWGNDEKFSPFNSSRGDVVISWHANWVAGDDNSPQKIWQEELLLNGFVGVTNLVSWPRDLSVDQEQSLFIVPAIDDTLSHVRHTINILLNQHRLPVTALQANNDPTVLFQLDPQQPLSFLAVVENTLAYADIAGEAEPIRCWTNVQEVRLLHPQAFARFLAQAEARYLDPVESLNKGFVNPNALGEEFHYVQGHFQIATSRYLRDVFESYKEHSGNLIIVEASTPHWLRLSPQSRNRAQRDVTFQYLPNGTQSATLSQPDDFVPDESFDWLLLQMPFLGRLQPIEDDGLLDWESKDGIQIDPILQIQREMENGHTLSDFALHMSTWGRESVTMRYSAFDAAAGRSWRRIDPTSLEESWFRLQLLPPESHIEALQSILVSQPDGPSRLSRATTLTHLLNPQRPNYPPQAFAPDTPESSEDAVAWQQQSWLMWQALGFDSDHADFKDENARYYQKYAWWAVGLQLSTSGLLPEFAPSAPMQHSSATMLATPIDSNNLWPQTVAVSPYVSFRFSSTTSTDLAALELVAVSAELVTVAPNSGQLQPMTSHLFEVANLKVQSNPLDTIRTMAVDWAQRTHKRLTPDAPLAILRLREILGDHASGIVATRYSFLPIPIALPDRVLRRAFQLRTKVENLRFQEGQFAGAINFADTLAPFEVAPPLFNGVQGIQFKRESSDWGLSVMRVGVQVTEGKRGVSAENKLWWQMLQHHVQYRHGLDGSKAVAGLPPKFRARAINSLLSLPLNPPLPSRPNGDWQATLPGTTRYLLKEVRSGVFFSMRHQLLRQTWHQSDAGEVVLASSVPFQIRSPRPIPLPPNEPGRETMALQTWASYFAPLKRLSVGQAPFDEAFLGAKSFRQAVDQPTILVPAIGARVVLSSPAFGLVSTNWDGRGQLAFSTFGGGIIPDIEILIRTDSQLINFNFTEQNEENVISFSVDGDSEEELQDWLASQSHGQQIEITVRVKLAHENFAMNSFWQTLRLPLRIFDPEQSRLPLEPRFIQFEDPEYNRALATQTGVVTGMFAITHEDDILLREIQIATDRINYNTDSQLFCRYDWKMIEGVDNSLPKLDVVLRKLDRNNVPTGETRLENVEHGHLLTFDLGEFNKDVSRPLVAGDKLLISLQSQDGKQEIALTVDIVAEPVNPAPMAAYALLRSEGNDAVACQRFAWRPIPQRIELVNSDDLKTGLVRRRAVFQWQDVIRAKNSTAYTIQKITLNGSTHIVELNQFIPGEADYGL